MDNHKKIHNPIQQGKRIRYQQPPINNWKNPIILDLITNEQANKVLNEISNRPQNLLYGLMNLENQYIYIINTEIDQHVEKDFVETIYNLNNVYVNYDPSQIPNIILYLNSYGGTIDSEIQIIEQMEQSLCPIIQFVPSVQMSQQQLIFISQDYRIISPRQMIMFHDFLINVEGKYSEIKQEQQWFERIRQITQQTISSRTKLPQEIIENIFAGKDYYFNQEEQLKYGLADLIGKFNGQYFIKYAEMKDDKMVIYKLPEKSIFLDIIEQDTQDTQLNNQQQKTYDSKNKKRGKKNSDEQ